MSYSGMKLQQAVAQTLAPFSIDPDVKAAIEASFAVLDLLNVEREQAAANLAARMSEFQ